MRDALVGLTVGVMLVPQAMAYAMLAGLAPIAGLYASTVPLVVYACFGGSRHLAVGPVAIISLMVYSSVSTVATPGSPEYAVTAALLALLVGAMQVLMGVARLGILANFISHSVMRGFTSAAAIVIGLSQLKHLLGISLSDDVLPVYLLSEAVMRAAQANPATLVITGAALILLFMGKRYAPRLPVPLLVVLVGVACVALWRLDLHQVTIVGTVPAGLPVLRLPALHAVKLLPLLPMAVLIAFLGFMESISIAKMLAAREREKIDSNRELVSIGLANLAASACGAYPVTGSFSRSAVTYLAGGRTRVAGALTALFVMLALLFLTPHFFYLPKAVLAAIVVVAVSGLVDVRALRDSFRVRSTDGWACLLTFFGILTLGVEHGILLGITFSLLMLLWRTTRPYVAELGYVASERAFRDRLRFPDAARLPGLLILRIDSSLHFANSAMVEDRVRDFLADNRDTSTVLFDLSGTNDLDSDAVAMFREVDGECRPLGIRVCFAGMKGRVRARFARAGWPDDAAAPNRFPTLWHALELLGLAAGLTVSVPDAAASLAPSVE